MGVSLLSYVQNLVLDEFEVSDKSALSEAAAGHRLSIINSNNLELLIYKFDQKNKKEHQKHKMPLESLYKREEDVQVMADYIIFLTSKEAGGLLSVIVVNLKSSKPNSTNNLKQIFAGLLLADFICKTMKRLLLGKDKDQASMLKFNFYAVSCCKSVQKRPTSGKAPAPQPINIDHICREDLSMQHVYKVPANLKLDLFYKSKKS